MPRAKLIQWLEAFGVPIDIGLNPNKRIYCCLVDFRKASTLPHAKLIQWLEALGVLIDMQLGIYARYESGLKKVRSPNGLSEVVPSTIGVKQGCSLSPTLFSLDID